MVASSAVVGSSAISRLGLQEIAMAPTTRCRARARRARRSATEKSADLTYRLRALGTSAALLHVAAHPDDENNAMLAFYAHGNGFRTSLVAATRGDVVLSTASSRRATSMAALAISAVMSAMPHQRSVRV